MYELKCPSCAHVVSSAFVRVGAVVRCESCDTVYRVQPAHVTHHEPIPDLLASEGDEDALLSAPQAAGASQRARQQADAQARQARQPEQVEELPRPDDPAQDTGLTEDLQSLSDPQAESATSATDDEPASTAGATSIPPKLPADPEPTHRLGPPEHHRPRRTRTRTRTRTHGLLAGGLVAVLAVTGALIWVVSTGAGNGAAPASANANGDGAGNGSGTSNRNASDPAPENNLPERIDGTPVLHSTRIDASGGWRYNGRPPGNGDVNGVLLARVRNTNGELGRNDSEITIDIDPDRSVTEHVVARARLQIELTNSIGDLVAWTVVPLAPFRDAIPRPMSLPRPPRRSGMLGIDAEVRVLETIDRPVDLEATNASLQVHEGVYYVRLDLQNTTERVVSNGIIVVTGEDAAGRPRTQWRAMWRGTLAPGGRASVYVATPMSTYERGNLSDWSAEAIGEQQY